MRHIPIIPIVLVLFLTISVSCNKYTDEVLPTNETSNSKLGKFSSVNNQVNQVSNVSILDLDIPQFFVFDTKDKNFASNWITIENSMYEGEIRITTDSKGFINSIKVRGEIADHIQNTYLTQGLGSLPPYPQVTTNQQLALPQEWKEKVFCMNNCMGINPSALRIAACAGVCAFA